MKPQIKASLVSNVNQCFAGFLKTLLTLNICFICLSPSNTLTLKPCSR